MAPPSAFDTIIIDSDSDSDEGVRIVPVAGPSRSGSRHSPIALPSHRSESNRRKTKSEGRKRPRHDSEEFSDATDERLSGVIRAPYATRSRKREALQQRNHNSAALTLSAKVIDLVEGSSEERSPPATPSKQQHLPGPKQETASSMIAKEHRDDLADEQIAGGQRLTSDTKPISDVEEEEDELEDSVAQSDSEPKNGPVVPEAVAKTEMTVQTPSFKGKSSAGDPSQSAQRKPSSSSEASANSYFSAQDDGLPYRHTEPSSPRVATATSPDEMAGTDERDIGGSAPASASSSAAQQPAEVAVHNAQEVEPAMPGAFDHQPPQASTSAQAVGAQIVKADQNDAQHLPMPGALSEGSHASQAQAHMDATVLPPLLWVTDDPAREIRPELRHWATQIFERLRHNVATFHSHYADIAAVKAHESVLGNFGEQILQQYPVDLFVAGLRRAGYPLDSPCFSPYYHLATLYALSDYLTQCQQAAGAGRPCAHTSTPIAVFHSLTEVQQTILLSVLAGATDSLEMSNHDRAQFPGQNLQFGAAQLVATTEGADIDMMGHLRDTVAVAEMANLQQCSDEGLQQLRQAGLRTQLKSHQSSGVKYLVDAEHRRLPQHPRDGEECLWAAVRTWAGIKFINRVKLKGTIGTPRLPRGAILADAMGLGKTLTILALILAPADGGKIVGAGDSSDVKGKEKVLENGNKISSPTATTGSPKRLVKGKMAAKSPTDAHRTKEGPRRAIVVDSDSEDEKYNIWSSDDDDDNLQPATISPHSDAQAPALPTLIICPMSVISNWTQQADAHTSKPKMRYAVLYGREAHALKREKDWKKYDFIVTTYDWIKGAHRDIALFEQCAERVREHREKVESLEEDIRVLRSAAPLSTTKRKHLDEKISLLEHLQETEKDAFVGVSHKGGRLSAEQLQECRDRAGQLPARTPDVYEQYTDAELYFIWTGQKNKALKEWARVFDQQWLRIVLDEAHVIRTFGTQVHAAVKRLRSERKIAVTGTPIVNSTTDLGALVSFLGVQPFDQDDARKLWMRHVDKPTLARDTRGMAILRSLTKSLVILRTKEMQVNGAPLVDLPPITMHRYEVEMKPDDMAFYQDCEIKLRQWVLRWAEDNEMNGKQACVLVFLQRLRQIANDRRLVPTDMIEQMEELAKRNPTSASGSRDLSEALTPEQTKALQTILAANVDNEEDCAICYDALSNVEDYGKAVILYCGHCYHVECIKRALENQEKCPYDQKTVKKDTKMIEMTQPDTPSIAETPLEVADDSGDSAKIDAIAEIVMTIRLTNPQDKIIIFSNFVGLLNLLAKRLDEDGAPYVTFFGSHSKVQREATLRSFDRPMPAPSESHTRDLIARQTRGAQPPQTSAGPSVNGETATSPRARSSILDFLDQMATDEAFSPRSKKSSKGKEKAKEDPVPQICLMSMGAGSVGLNLTVANHCILCDPWWSEPLAAQAINRTHRIGQQKPVKVYRLVSKGTVEHRVVDIAADKMELTTYALSGVKYKGATLFKGLEMGSDSRMGDIGSLFGMTQDEMVRLRAAHRRNNLIRR